MSLFSDKEIQQAMEQAVKEKLRQHGLSHLHPKVVRKSGDKIDIVFDGASESDKQKAQVALGGHTSEFASDDFRSRDTLLDNGLSLDSGLTIEPSVRISKSGQIASPSRIETRRKLKP